MDAVAVALDSKSPSTAAMVSDDVAKQASIATSRPMPDAPAPAFDASNVTYAFYMSDDSADPPNALRIVVRWPGSDVDMLASDAVPDDELALLRVVRARALIQARKTVGAV